MDFEFFFKIGFIILAGVKFSLIALFIQIVVVCHLITKKHRKYLSDKRYLHILRLFIFLLAGNIVSLINAVLIEMHMLVPNFIHSLATTVNILLILFSSYCFASSVIVYMGDGLKDYWYRFINRLFLAYMIFILMNNIFSGYVFSYDNFGYIDAGVLYDVARYIAPLYFYCSAAAFILTHKELFVKKQIVCSIVIVALISFVHFILRNLFANIYVIYFEETVASTFWLIASYNSFAGTDNIKEKRSEYFVEYGINKKNELKNNFLQSRKEFFSALKSTGFFLIGFLIAFVVLIVGTFLFSSEKKKSSLTEDTTNVVLLYRGNLNDRGCNQANYEALQSLSDELNLKIFTLGLSSKNTRISKTIEEVIEDEDIRLFISLDDEVNEMIEEEASVYPAVSFIAFRDDDKYSNFDSFAGKLYQSRYLAGMLAGLQTDSNKIGYIANSETAETMTSVNAFTVGARKANKDAKVYVAYADNAEIYVNDGYEAKRLVKEYPGIDIIVSHNNAESVLKAADEMGIYSIGACYDNSAIYPESSLTSVTWNWEEFYRDEIIKMLEGRFGENKYELINKISSKNLTPCSANVKKGIPEKIADEEKHLENSLTGIFTGPLYSNDRTLRVPSGEIMPDEVIIQNFNWYVLGVEIFES